MSCSSSSRLLLPRCAPASGVFAAVERDTRALALSDAERFNYYPATPLAVVSWIFEGALHPVQMVGTATGEPALSAPLPRLTLAGPQRRPARELGARRCMPCRWRFVRKTWRG